MCRAFGRVHGRSEQATRDLDRCGMESKIQTEPEIWNLDAPHGPDAWKKAGRWSERGRSFAIEEFSTRGHLRQHQRASTVIRNEW